MEVFMSDVIGKTIGDILAETGKGIVQIMTERAIEKYGSKQATLLAPIISQYGPIFAAMTSDQLWAWLETATKGDQFKAFSEIASRLSNSELFTEWTTNNAKTDTLNTQNAQNVDWNSGALATILKALVMLATSLVLL